MSSLPVKKKQKSHRFSFNNFSGLSLLDVSVGSRPMKKRPQPSKKKASKTQIKVAWVQFYVDYSYCSVHKHYKL